MLDTVALRNAVDNGSVKGVIFDFGGTLDTLGDHWGPVIYDYYMAADAGISRVDFRDAYIMAERALSLPGMVSPTDTFHQLLNCKIGFQMQRLTDRCRLSSLDANRLRPIITESCYKHACAATTFIAPTLEVIAKRKPIAVVSNFYGNLRTVLEEFGLLKYFTVVVDSAVVGVSKPDPRIFAIACEKLGLEPEQVLVVGDSIDKDMEPATKLGCHTEHISGRAWNELF
jgi:putative hydrolase of the HAD superfamily